ncbi:MAG TPA: hypothetical protein PKL88_00440 [bacterium]|nr:hypothetical protein [bacterium]
MKKILWLSRHEPLPFQAAELERLFGEVEIRQDVNPFKNAEEIKQRFERGGYDDLVVVAPLWVIFYLTELGVYPLWADMQEVSFGEKFHLTFNGRFYLFNRFKRIVGIEIKFQDIETKNEIKGEKNGCK